MVSRGKSGDIQLEHFRCVSCLYVIALALTCITSNDTEVSPSDRQDCASVFGIRVEGLLDRLWCC